MTKIFITIIFVLFCQSVSASSRSQSNTIMVTAATGAFGKGICDLLASEGYDLIIAGRNQKKLDGLKDALEIKNKHIKVQVLIIDFSDTKTVENALKEIPQVTIKGIVLIGPRPILSKNVIPSESEWSKVFLETFIAPLEVLRLFGPQLQNNGSVVVVSGSSSKNYLPSYANTNVLRVAWIGEVKNLAYFFGDRKIRVNAISPGAILTKHHEENINKKAISNNLTFEEQLNKDTSTIPLKTYGKTEDVANLISFLLSHKSAHLNGMNILLDGGESSAY